MRLTAKPLALLILAVIFGGVKYGAQERARLACKLQEAASRARLEIDGYSPETHEGLAMLQILHALLASVEAAK